MVAEPRAKKWTPIPIPVPLVREAEAIVGQGRYASVAEFARVAIREKIDALAEAD